MEKVRPWCGQPSDQGRLRNRTDQTVVCLSCPVLSCLSVCNIGVLWPKGWMDQDETWHVGRPRSWPHCVRCRASSPQKGGHSPPNFRPMSIVAKRLDRSDTTYYEGRPRPRPHGDPTPPKGTQPQIFCPCLLWSR